MPQSLVDIQIEGQEELQLKLADVAKKVQPRQLIPILMRAAKDLQQDVKRNTPLGATGNLRRGIVAKPLRNIKTFPVAALTAVDYSVAPHMHLVEYGHGGPHPAEPHPYFHPVIQDRAAATLQWIFGEIQKVIDGEINK